LPLVFLFFPTWYGDHRYLHSFPTRRSSDLGLPLIGDPDGGDVCGGQSRLAERFGRCVQLRGPDLRGVVLDPTRRGKNLGHAAARSEEHTSELQSRFDLVCRLLLEKKNKNKS